MKGLASMCVLAVALGTSAGGAWAQATVCEVVALRGEASGDGHALKLGERLAVGAELSTGAQGRVRLRFDDGSTLVLGDNTRLKLDQYEAGGGQPRTASMLLKLGLIGQQVSPVPGGRWQVRTPSAVTAVRGTEFMVEVTEDQRTAVNVQSGEVAVQPTGGMHTRSLGRPVPSFSLAVPRAGTQCDADGECSAVTPWTEQRVKALQDRLGGV